MWFTIMLKAHYRPRASHHQCMQEIIIQEKNIYLLLYKELNSHYEMECETRVVPQSILLAKYAVIAFLTHTDTKFFRYVIVLHINIFI